MRLIASRMASLVLLSLAALSPARAQGAPPATPPATPPAITELVRVVLDCESQGCDDAFLRTEITWVNFVRDRSAASVFVLVTAQTTGSGGRHMVMNFDGQGPYAGVRDSLSYTTPQGATNDEARRALARTLSFGLLRYARGTSVGNRLQLTLRAADANAAPAPTQATRDRWNLWVYSVGANVFANGDDNYQSTDVSGSIDARRVTEQWKLSVSGNGNYSANSFKLTSGTIANYQHSFGGRGMAVKSLTPHWSAGLTGSARSSKYENYRLAVNAMPAIEYDVFPYAESTRRQIIVRYAAGVQSFRYDSTTIFGTRQETRPSHALTLAAEARQKWGSLNVGISGTQLLDDLAKYHVGINGGASWRIVRGLEFNAFGSYAVIRDQLNIPRGELADEDILIRLRQLRSGFNFFGSVGLSYTFGSMLNNVVNPRFGGGMMMRM